MTTEYKISPYYTTIQNRFYRCFKLKGHILKIMFLLVYVLQGIILVIYLSGEIIVKTKELNHIHFT